MGGNSKGKQEDQAVERLQLRGQTGAGSVEASVEAFARGGVRAALRRGSPASRTLYSCVFR